ncbi:MAG TPA: alpha/beta hydrolase [Pseudolysinimonas sp.]|nr:alpha/beta hydrolase [Pseudolysinimonas sp.]
MERRHGWFRRPPLLHVAVDTGTGPAVVLIHGIASSSVTFENVVPLVEGTHRVIAIDLLGFGGSPAPADSQYTVEEHVASLARTLRALRLREPFVLVGHSMGSLIAARYSASRRARLRRLVMVSPPIYLAPEAIGGRRDRAAMALYLRLYEYLRTNKDFTIRAAAGLARFSPIKNVLVVSEANWRPFVLSLQNSIEAQTSVSDLASVRVPVEVVYGSLDPLLAPSGMRVIAQLRNVTVHRVDGGDHVIRPRMARVVATAIG